MERRGHFSEEGERGRKIGETEQSLEIILGMLTFSFVFVVAVSLPMILT